MKKFKVLLSVYNISGYLVSELKALCQYADIAVIETPCEGIGKEDISVRWINRTQLTSLSDVDNALGDFSPDIFLCGGWADKLMLDLAKRYRHAGVTAVLMIDTPWKGNWKQILHCLYSRFSLVPRFNYAWGAGIPQAKHLHLLGFPWSRIRKGVYCANTEKFAPIGKSRANQGAKPWPHVFLYIGRYVAVKNMERMQSAFLKAIERMQHGGQPCDWKLRCIGDGTLWEKRIVHPQIEHLGYKPPEEIQNYVQNAGCFVLPSVYEPWGVVVHEAALMGLPMLCSNKIQAASAYLKEGVNGYSFDPYSEDELVNAYLKIMQMSDANLTKMGRCSFMLGMQYTNNDWAKIVCEFYQREERK